MIKNKTETSRLQIGSMIYGETLLTIGGKQKLEKCCTYTF